MAVIDLWCEDDISANAGSRARLVDAGASLIETAGAPLRAQLAELGACASDPNPFAEPFMLAPAFETIAKRDNAKILLLGAPGRLVGAMVVTKRMRLGRAPLPHWAAYAHRHHFLSAPLVRRGCEAAFARALYDWMDGASMIAPFMSISQLPKDGEVYKALEAVARQDQRRFEPIVQDQRATLARGRFDDYDAHLKAVCSSEGRKKLRAKRRKLEAQGALCYERLSVGADPSAWTDEFLALEHAGWKGEAGTSLLSCETDAGYFRRLIEAAHGEGRLWFSRLRLGERTIATSVDFLAGEGAYAFKIAHAPDLERLSPGVVLEHENMSAFYAQDAVRWIDSCAAAGHSVLDRLWPERRALAHVVIGRKAGWAKMALSATLAARNICGRSKPGSSQ